MIVSEGNSFVWPGPDLRFPPADGPQGAAYGMLPAPVFNAIKQRFLMFVRDRRASVIKRTD